MPAQPLEVQPGLVIPGSELEESFARAGGSGGQHVNKVSTKAILRWNVRESSALSETQRGRLLNRLAARLTRQGDLVLQASSSRSQSANLEEVRVRLAELVRKALQVQRKRRPTRPSRASKERRLKAKKLQGSKKSGRRRQHED